MRWIALFLLPVSLVGADLDPRYCVIYGSQDAPAEVVEYFSFACPQCARLFVQEFEQIRSEYLDSGRVRWIFHPIPVDLPTVQAMACLEKLSGAQKKIFLEEIMSAARELPPPAVTSLMQRMLDLVDDGLNLTDLDVLEKTPAFNAAFHFIKEGTEIEGVPTVAINGKLFPQELPTAAFIQKVLP